MFKFLNNLKVYVLYFKVIKEPRILLTRIEKIFQAYCFFLAIYWITYFSSQYAENSDTTFISMKTFNDGPDDKYPTFTICFKGPKFHWIQDDNIFHSYAMNPVQYEKMLVEGIGLRYELNKSTKVYEKKSVVLSDGIDVNFDQYHLKLTDFLTELQYSTDRHSNGVALGKWGDIAEAELHFNLSYHTAHRICFSRSSNDKISSIRRYDMITFNSTVLKKYPETEMEVFIHHPQQLIRSFQDAKYKTSFEYLTSALEADSNNSPKTLEFKITQVKQLRKRHTSATPCLDDIPNYDKYYEEGMIVSFGCIPPYWMRQFSNFKTLEQCTSPMQLDDAHLKIDNQERIGRLKEIPCNEMILLSIDNINNEPFPKPTDISIEFIYPERSYEEIKYNKMMGFEGWLSNVGGFVGIFLGYSMLQIPELLAYITGLFKEQRHKNIKSKCKSKVILIPQLEWNLKL